MAAKPKQPKPTEVNEEAPVEQPVEQTESFNDGRDHVVVEEPKETFDERTKVTTLWNIEEEEK